jgi:hypothetical protein
MTSAILAVCRSALAAYSKFPERACYASLPGLANGMMHHTKIVTRRRIVRYRILGFQKINVNSTPKRVAFAGIVFASIGAWQPRIGCNQNYGCPSLL